MSADDNQSKATAKSKPTPKGKAGGAARSAKNRLKAMQAKHESLPDKATEAFTPSGTPGAAGLMADLQAVMAGGQSGAGMTIFQKLRQVLSGPDGRIDPQRARMAMAFVRKQAADPAAPRHELAKKIEGMVQNMPPQQRQRLMAAAGMGAGRGGGLGARQRGPGTAGSNARGG